MDLVQRIGHWGQVAPERLAHVSAGRRLTYGELARRSDSLANYLTRQLPDDHSPLAVYGHKEPEMLIAFLAAIKSGHPYVPIDTISPPLRVAYIVSTAGARLTLTPERVAALTNGAPDEAPLPGSRLEPSDPFYIIFTSGSTGEPKGAVITLGCLSSFVDWMLAEHAFAEQGEVFLNQAPFSFDLSVMDLYLSLITGGTLWSVTRDEVANPAQLFRSLADSGITVWVSTPSFAQVCLAERRFSASMLPCLRRFLFCGETLPPDVAAELLERFPDAQVWNTYGPTEATVATTSVRIDRDILARYPTLPVGHPKPDCRILLLDGNGQPVSGGERGEIVIAGPNVGLGYIGRPELTGRAFFDLDGMRAYRTGDWGRFRDGLLFFEGRADHQVKLRGFRIEMGDIEANLRALPGVRDAAVMPRLAKGQVDALAAFVVLAERHSDSDFEIERRLRAQLAERLPAYMIPRKFYLLSTFPMTPNGKVDRRKLAEMLE